MHPVAKLDTNRCSPTCEFKHWVSISETLGLLSIKDNHSSIATECVDDRNGTLQTTPRSHTIRVEASQSHSLNLRYSAIAATAMY
jgi:hypothetical protein